jgi:endoglucanase
MTDNLVYDPKLDSGEVRNGRSGIADDRWVFTEQNPRRSWMLQQAWRQRQEP